MDESMVRAQMTGDDFRRLTAAFYRRVKTDDVLGPLYPPDDWAGAEQRLADFLCFRLLGEPKYIEERGHPRLRMRHAPFSIGVAERDRWLALMDAAMEETGVPDLSVAVLRPLFRQVADFMRNRDESAPSAPHSHS
jgi:hemoglobin